MHPQCVQYTLPSRSQFYSLLEEITTECEELMAKVGTNLHLCFWVVKTCISFKGREQSGVQVSIQFWQLVLSVRRVVCKCNPVQVNLSRLKSICHSCV